jgi:hypothetical protein
VTLPSWSDVLATALVGTQRRTLPLIIPGSVPTDASAKSDASAEPVASAAPVGDPAEALLDAAAALTLYRRAGAAPRTELARPEPAPDDSGVPLVSGAAGTRLADLLAIGGPARMDGPVRDADGRLELLAEWLGAAIGRRVPGELLPALLDTGRRHRALRPLIATAGGTRAAWLADQRSDWAYLRAEAVEHAAAVEPVPVGLVPVGSVASEALMVDREAWELGAIGRRVGFLTAARRRDPSAARALLEAVWAGETPDDRAALLGALATGLSTADESLLEIALDDRRKEVRIAAIELLARLPDSAYAQRMAARSRACVRVVGSRVRILAPAACDTGMRRDGITPRPPVGVGERAWWLEELITRTPLREWGAPDTFLAMPATDEWAPVLRRGLARAAAAQADPAWATALTGPLTEEVTAGGRPDDRLLLEALYDALPSDALVALAVGVLRRGLAGAAAVGVEHVLELCPRPWPPALTDAVFAALDDRTGRRAAGWRLAGLCELAALRLSTTVAGRAARLAAALPSDDPMTSIVGRFADTLRFRHDMLKELAQ